jgi:hypothetical protein
MFKSESTIINNTEPTELELRNAAKLALQLLQIDNCHNIALLLGYSADMSNIQAITAWMSEYIAKNPDQQSFTEHVYPALCESLNEYHRQLI